MVTRAAAETLTGPGYPLRTIGSALPTFSFLGALVTDVAYWRTSDIQWANFSAWLLAIGMVLGGLSLIVELVHIFPRRRQASTGWWGIGVLVIALGVALADNFIHARDGWTSVVPSGLILSVITVALMMATSAMIANCDRVRVGDLP
jgi:uncharacterized membrane protein